MQFAVPQFTEVEDRLIGSLTLRQFLVLLGTGGIVLFFWSVIGPNIVFFVLSLPIAIVGVASALGKYNGRPMFSYLMPFAAFLSSNRAMIFKREIVDITVSKSELKEKTKTKAAITDDLEPAESRLRKLAYLLDQKTEEEKELISEDELSIMKTAALPRINLTTPPVKLMEKKPVQRKSKPVLDTPPTISTVPKPEKETLRKFNPSDFIK